MKMSLRLGAVPSGMARALRHEMALSGLIGPPRHGKGLLDAFKGLSASEWAHSFVKKTVSGLGWALSSMKGPSEDWDVHYGR